MSAPKAFRELPFGATFDFVSGRVGVDSFFKRCTKTDSRKYVDEDGREHKIGSINACVFHVEMPAEPRS